MWHNINICNIKEAFAAAGAEAAAEFLFRIVLPDNTSAVPAVCIVPAPCRAVPPVPALLSVRLVFPGIINPPTSVMNVRRAVRPVLLLPAVPRVNPDIRCHRENALNRVIPGVLPAIRQRENAIHANPDILKTVWANVWLVRPGAAAVPVRQAVPNARPVTR